MFTVCTWKKGNFVGDEKTFGSLTEARFYMNRSGAIRGYIVDGFTGEILEEFGDEA